MCFGSLGSVRKDNWKVLRKFTTDKTYIKNVLKWCSILISLCKIILYADDTVLCTSNTDINLIVSELIMT